MMKVTVLSLVACALFSACGGDNGGSTPTGPTPVGYAGEWTGRTHQNQPFSFTVSSAQKVTAISVGYAFTGCSGVQTFSGLDIAISQSIAYFAHGASLPDGRAISVQVFFQASGEASGGVVFYGPPDCGSTGDGGFLQATRR